MKACTRCGTEKAADQFHRNSRAKDGLCSYCKACAKNVVNLWRLENPEKRKANQAKHYRKHRDAIAERQKQSRAANPDHTRALRKKHKQTHRLNRYGLTKAGLEQMLKLQHNRCAMCETEFTEQKRPVIDHCHQSGKTRDLLCSPCNTALGHIEKDGFLQRAMAYLAKHKRA